MLVNKNMKTNKNSLYSLLFLLLSIFTFIIVFNLSFLNFIYTQNRYEKINSIIYKLSNHRWINGMSNFVPDIYNLFLYLPFVLLAVSVFFGYRMLKNKDTVSAKIRMVGIVSVTVSSCLFIILILSFFLI